MIKRYEFLGSDAESWKFSPAVMSKINLLVGPSGSGKTRFLNTFFNFAEFVTAGKIFRRGKWNIQIIINDITYIWECECRNDENENPIIMYELLKRVKENQEKIIVRRDLNEFIFLDKLLPKLEKDVLSVTLLKEEEEIQPLYKAFSHVMRRRFHEDALNQAVSLTPFPPEFLKRIKKNANLDSLWKHDFPIQNKLYVFSEYFKDKYTTATEFFKSIFPTVEKTEIRLLDTPSFGSATVVPVFMVGEKGVKELIPISELSSGMQKVMLIITDILSLVDDSIYIIDEYENSLGVNAIDFLPEFLIGNSGKNQFIITTHHPYLINNMPIKNWLIFNRKGSEVTIKNGSEFEEKFGKSKQKAFIQLLSDPFYKGE